METKDVMLGPRTQKGWSQEELAQKLYVTRQVFFRQKLTKVCYSFSNSPEQIGSVVKVGVRASS